ncbi:MAG: ATP-dependent RecD-like DNA helicase [Oscillospiraceae bacterium]|nr:ATP-dependent RecD-like DNA helicase [Oscillospiraceae bacterium]
MEEQLHNQVEGVVSSIIFQNEENGYTILRMNAGQGDITAVGCMPGAAPGETLVLRGTWVRHPSYGEQFKAESVERRLPQGIKEVFHYLASGVVRGIGQSTARRMVEMFGEDALTVLESEPEKLTQIRGISLKRAKAMSEDFRQQMGMRLLLAFLSDHGLNVQLGAALYRQWGNVALEVVKNDPYVLINEEWGVDFSRADALAADLGMAAENTSRLDAALIFELTHNMNNGHTFLPRGKLLQATCQLTGVGESALVKRLDDLLQHGGLTQEDVAGEEAIYLEEMHRAECSVAERLHTMSRRSLTPPAHMDGLLEQIQQELDIRYAPEQLRAVELAASSQVMLLTGGPGTGKTTTLRGVLALFDRLGLNTALAAPTGRAANRLGELCRAEASTIHRMLEPGIDPYTGRLVFSKNGDEPLDVDAVIVDETSMVDITLMSALLDALGDDCRLILVGDPDQLPSVGPGCVFSDLIRSRTVPAVCLTEIFRQAAQSAIVRNAHQVNGGVLPDLKENDNDFFFLSRKDPVAACQTIVDLCRRRLPERMGIPAEQIQVLSPTRRRQAGTAALNRALQEALNPPEEGKEERRFGENVFRRGDRVMQVKNNYELLWREQGGKRSGVGVFNGDIGTIVSAAPRGETMTVDFDGRLVEYTPDLLGELEPAYAVTVHKAQGSEYRAVILAAVDAAPMLLTRGVLYTAITRARSLLIIVGDEEVVERMVANDRQTRRYCALRARLCRLAEEDRPREKNRYRLALDRRRGEGEKG